MFWTFLSEHPVLIVAILLFLALVVMIIISMTKSSNVVEWIKGIADISAIALLFVCAVGVIFAGLSWFQPRQPVKPDYNLVLSVAPDSTGFDVEKFSFYSDSLMSVINRHERVLDEKYASFISEKEHALRIESIVGILLSVIVAIVGFFGYKNIKSIEKKAVDIAKDRVSKEVSDYLDDNLVGKIRQELKSSFFNYIDEKTSNKLASQVKGEIKKEIIDDIEEKIREDVVDYFTLDVREKSNSRSASNNPFEKK